MKKKEKRTSEPWTLAPRCWITDQGAKRAGKSAACCGEEETEAKRALGSRLLIACISARKVFDGLSVLYDGRRRRRFLPSLLSKGGEKKQKTALTFGNRNVDE